MRVHVLLFQRHVSAVLMALLPCGNQSSAGLDDNISSTDSKQMIKSLNNTTGLHALPSPSITRQRKKRKTNLAASALQPFDLLCCQTEN